MKLFFLLVLILLLSSSYSQNSPVSNISVGGNSKENYKTISYVFTGINSTLTAFNSYKYLKGKQPNTNGGFAILTGVSQVLYANFESDGTRNIDALNYTTGTLTTIIGALMLINRKKKKTDNLSFQPYIINDNDRLILGVIIPIK